MAASGETASTPLRESTAGDNFVEVEEGTPEAEGSPAGELVRRASFDTDSPATTKRLTSLRKRAGKDDDDAEGADNTGGYYDGDLGETDLVPLDEQDAEHNWEALNQRILSRMNEEHKWMVEHRIIHPMGPFRKRWDFVQVILLAYVAMLVPCECSRRRQCPPPCLGDRLTVLTLVSQIGFALTTMQKSTSSCSGSMCAWTPTSF